MSSVSLYSGNKGFSGYQRLVTERTKQSTTTQDRVRQETEDLKTWVQEKTTLALDDAVFTVEAKAKITALQSSTMPLATRVGKSLQRALKSLKAPYLSLQTEYLPLFGYPDTIETVVKEDLIKLIQQLGKAEIDLQKEIDSLHRTIAQIKLLPKEESPLLQNRPFALFNRLLERAAGRNPVRSEPGRASYPTKYRKTEPLYFMWGVLQWIAPQSQSGTVFNLREESSWEDLGEALTEYQESPELLPSTPKIEITQTTNTLTTSSKSLEIKQKEIQDEIEQINRARRTTSNAQTLFFASNDPKRVENLKYRCLDSVHQYKRAEQLLFHAKQGIAKAKEEVAKAEIYAINDSTIETLQGLKISTKPLTEFKRHIKEAERSIEKTEEVHQTLEKGLELLKKQLNNTWYYVSTSENPISWHETITSYFPSNQQFFLELYNSREN